MTTEETPTYIQPWQAPYEGAVRDPNDMRRSGWATFQNAEDIEARFTYTANDVPDQNWDGSVRDILRYAYERGSLYRFMYFDHPSWYENGRKLSGHRKYLGYDYSRQDEPVNQLPDLRNWRADVALFAHGFDVVHGTRTNQESSDKAKDVITRLCYGLGGHAWQTLALWEQFNAATDPFWKNARTLPAAAMEALCAECDVETWARRLLRNIDVTRFETELNGGKINATVRTTTPWTPGAVVTQVSQGGDTAKTVSAFHDAFKASFLAALDYYDAHVAATQTPHGHP